MSRMAWVVVAGSIAGIVGAGFYGYTELQEATEHLRESVEFTNRRLDAINESLEVVSEQVTAAASQGNVRELRERLDSMRHDVDLLRIDLDNVRGGSDWHPARRDVIELNEALADVEAVLIGLDGNLVDVSSSLDIVEGCLRSLLDVLDGTSFTLGFECSLLPRF